MKLSGVIRWERIDGNGPLRHCDGTYENAGDDDCWNDADWIAHRLTQPDDPVESASPWYFCEQCAKHEKDLESR